MQLTIKVIPKSKLNKIEKISDTEYKIHLTAPPTDGKANEHLIRLLSKHFKTAKSNIKIIRGKKGRKKIIKIMQ